MREYQGQDPVHFPFWVATNSRAKSSMEIRKLDIVRELLKVKY
jgi:hypothetical protein